MDISPRDEPSLLRPFIRPEYIEDRGRTFVLPRSFSAML